MQSTSLTFFPPSPGENVRETDDYPQVRTPPPGVEIISPRSSPYFYGFLPEETYDELLVTRKEIDVIDGVKIVSFKDLSDLEEYSRTHDRALTYPMKGEPSPPVGKLKSQRIMPTKTGDITKIKGWRNKVFASELDHDHNYTAVNPPPVPEPRKILGKCGETVWEIVSYLVDYVVRKETFDVLDIPLDPDVAHLVASDDIVENHPKKYRKSRVARELSKLCNVSLVEEDKTDLNKSLCSKEHCLKGCVCDSLSGELLDDTEPHCRNEECMFECSCDKYSRWKGMLSARKSNLAKEESTWHQKVICNTREVVFQGDIVKNKREKKMPTRYRQGDLHLGKEVHFLDPSPKHLKNVKSKGNLFDENLNSVVSSSKRRYPPKLCNPDEIPAKSPLKDVVNDLTSEDTPEKEVLDNEEDSADEDSSVKRRRLDVIPEHQESDDAPIFETDGIEGALGEMAGLENYAFIWCTLHSDYYCSYPGRVFCTKFNILIKERIHSMHCALKALMSNAARFDIIHPFNTEHECARTAGSCFNYRTRNKSLFFKGKRELEIKHNIFSSTNSLVKLHYERLDNFISYFEQVMSKVKAVEEVIAASCHPRADELLDRIHSKVHQKFSNRLSSDGESPSCSGTERTSSPSREAVNVVDLDSGSESASLSLSSVRPTPLDSPPSQMNETAENFKFRLLCMTPGFGYLPVNCYTPDKLSIRDPLNTSVFHTFRDLRAANLWLNRFFKERIMFEDIDVKLEWVIVKANLLKEFHIFDRSVLLKVNKGTSFDKIFYCPRALSTAIGSSSRALQQNIPVVEIRNKYMKMNNLKTTEIILQKNKNNIKL